VYRVAKSEGSLRKMYLEEEVASGGVPGEQMSEIQEKILNIVNFCCLLFIRKFVFIKLEQGSSE